MKPYEGIVLLMAPLGTGLAAFDYANGWDSAPMGRDGPTVIASRPPPPLAAPPSSPRTRASMVKTNGGNTAAALSPSALAPASAGVMADPLGCETRIAPCPTEIPPAVPDLH